jgi:hypothetical protein
MKKKLLLSIVFFLAVFTNAIAKATASNPVVVEITATTLDQVYYHQTNFSVPTKLVFTNLTSVSGYVYFHQTNNLVEVDFPQLTSTTSYVYFHGNTSLEKINMPLLQSVTNYLYVAGNTSLTTLNVCNLQQVNPDEMGMQQYYYIMGNTPAVDVTPACFSLGGPANLALSANAVVENEPLSTVVGTLSADSNYPSGTLTFALDEMGDNWADNNKFKIEGNVLKTKSIFDYETDNEYTISIKVTNQLGETITENFTINITDVATENLQVIEITDATMDNVYYHQVSFSQPTKLVFTNLTSVSGYVYFHQNPNLVEVDFPALTQTGEYVYFHGNLSLETAKLPVLHTVHSYLYFAGNTALTTLEVCALANILPGSGSMEPYYYLQGNTPAVDNLDCFTLGAPYNVQLSANTVSENAAVNTVVGTLSADTNYPSGTLTFSLDALGSLDNDNSRFNINGNQLRTSTTFDYEAGDEYNIVVRVTNQIGEYAEKEFTIDITDIASEPVQTVYVNDVTLDNVYYHQVSFQQPTKLVFSNLTSVGGYVYFHQNVNLVEVEFPLLTQTGQYFYCHGNQSLEKMSAPELHTVHQYLYVASNQSLNELNICALAQILPDGDFDMTPYYYIEGNPMLDFDTTCLVNTTITYTPVENVIVLPAPDTLIGTFSCDTNDPVTYYFIDENGEPTTNDDFIIVGNGLYLAHDISYYTDTNFVIDIGSIRVNVGRSANSDPGLNELNKIVVVFNATALGVPGHPTTQGISLSPNPAVDFFDIRSNETIESVAIFDMLGRKVGGAQLEGNRADVGHLQSGSYMAIITTESGKTTTKKVIVNK